jgi:hypothetical protein
MPNVFDIRDDNTYAISSDVLHRLLKDHTMSKSDEQVNIFWATDSYASYGEGFRYNDPITEVNGRVIEPRAQKCRELQQQRSREMAEVFTPSWICNKQNNLIDNSWFGRENVFNTEVDNPDGSHSWITTPDTITFPKGKTWKNYVSERRLEITCGEAPYLVSRYDTVTGEPIALEHRIGLLDRKLRVVSENTTTTGDWLRATRIAYQNTYGYEWQGDNLLLARKALLYTFIDYYQAKFGQKPATQSLNSIAYIISWNIWQMDGLKGVIPNSCKTTVSEGYTIFGDIERTVASCAGCQSGNITQHNGTYALIKDWRAGKKLRFIDLMN